MGIVASWKFKHGPKDRFPSLADLFAIEQEMREATWAKVKTQTPDVKDLLNPNRTTSNHGKEALALIARLASGKMSREQYLAAMYAMHEKYPNIQPERDNWKHAADELKAFWDSEPKRQESGRRYLERIWRAQDAKQFTAHNNPDWYVESLKRDPVIIEKQEPQEDQPRPPIIKREFASGVEKAKFYADLFSRKN